ncbi:hypothetical protein [Pseudobacteriovorax antillogorgiicola]|uniref:Uncharacterized protein n=1 Tax=Pseudobacteriovorax antillogorgiicola TaxID=1513793 RepID=A0A1Y6BEG4_9BACT|nr:hypothetical protein [Pseudobacteriovorax antillogorgiicola]TCS57483.1 hypothetical protein EDD56_103223 [Pseudobacteriovorax antillogorgiicola]SMF00531.1 hypothetical protein SAMN06296036_103110 [Pseudobacteriovorax antillogorgiicola]
MKFTDMNNLEVIEATMDQENLLVSLFLPFGIPGHDEDELKIERKNTLAAAKERLSDDPDPFWAEALKAATNDLEALIAGKLEASPLPAPFTVAYYFNKSTAIRTFIADSMTSYVSFAPFAELEPLVYNEWAAEPYIVLQLDPENPSFLEGQGTRLEGMKISIPDSLRTSVGDSLEDFHFKKLMDTTDRNRSGAPDIEKRSQSDVFGYGSRQNSQQDNNRSYWLKIISLLIRSNIDAERHVFMQGDERLCLEFIHQNSDLRISKDNYLGMPKERESNRDLGQKILEIIVDRKLNDAESSMASKRLEKDGYQVLDLVRTGQTRDLFIQQLDWFHDHNHPSDRYQYENPRSAIIARALKYQTKIHYIRNGIPNKHHMAAVAY